jgi:hypothetical protein
MLCLGLMDGMGAKPKLTQTAVRVEMFALDSDVATSLNAQATPTEFFHMVNFEI